jgi:hypothetical protein
VTPLPLTDLADVTAVSIGQVLRAAEMLDLGVLEHLVDGIDRTAGHAGGAQVSVDSFSVSLLISALSASRLFLRTGAVASSGGGGRSGAPIA